MEKSYVARKTHRPDTGHINTHTHSKHTLEWPGLAQVYQYRSQRKNTKTHEITYHTQYGITGLLSSETASAKNLLKLRREHWTLENKVHWMRDNVLGEDASQARTGNLPDVMAALRNTALSLLRFDGQRKSLKQCDFSLQTLNSQLNSSSDKS